VYAPVADLDLEPENPIVQTRSFGDQAGTVGEHVAGWIRAAEAEGVATSAKHYPGHGRTSADSHDTLPVVEASPAELASQDLEPFRAAIRGGTRSIMSAHVAYPRWDTTGNPASLSPPILRELRLLGFNGVIVSDALIMEGAVRGRGESGAVVDAVAAGVDALLYPRDTPGVVRALDTALGGRLPRDRADDALARVGGLAAGLQAVSPSESPRGDHRAFADAVADLAVHALRGVQLSLREPLEIIVVDDDVGGPYTVGPRDLFARDLRERGLRLATGGSRIVLIYAEPRSWKGRAWLGAGSLSTLRRALPDAALVVLFSHPRLAAQVGGDMPIICAFHGQPLMQRAAARWVAQRVR
jgi:beta-N-acetylhexosaminidase